MFRSPNCWRILMNALSPICWPRVRPAPSSPSSVIVEISNRSRSSARPIDSPSGAARKPVAMPPAVSASEARSPVPSSLTGRLKMISARMSDSSSGRRAGQRQLRCFHRSLDPDAGLDAGIRDGAGGGDIERGVDLRLAHEPEGPAALQVEAPALKLVGAPDGFDRRRAGTPGRRPASRPADRRRR